MKTILAIIIALSLFMLIRGAIGEKEHYIPSEWVPGVATTTGSVSKNICNHSADPWEEPECFKTIYINPDL